jgi:hypothetical protein
MKNEKPQRKIKKEIKFLDFKLSFLVFSFD